MTNTTKSEFPYKTGEQSYNRESGRKTLLLVGICVALVTIFATLSLLLLNN